jgi:hypothetical protein
MALTLSRVSRWANGNHREVIFDVTFDSSYNTGGESLTASDLGLHKIQHIAAGTTPAGAAGTTAVVAAFDYTNNKLQAFQSTTGAPSTLVEVAATTDLSTYVVRIRAVGH